MKRAPETREFLSYLPLDSPWYAFTRIMAGPARNARHLERPMGGARWYRKSRVDRVTAIMLFMGVGANVLILLNDDVRWLLPTMGLVLTLVLPTRLISKALKAKIRGPGIRVPLALSLTVLALMIGGLILNTLLPLVGDSHPLSAIPILGLVDVINVTIIALRPRSLERDGLGYRRLGPLETWLVGLTVLSVLLAVLGAVRLNNGAGGGLAEIALCVATLIAIALMSSTRRVGPGVLLVCLYGIALTVLYMTSLRGWYTTGHDIQVEFRVFSLVHKAQLWSASQGGTTYDACLSITILPQLLWEMTRVATPYVFKVDFPLIFAACPVALYESARRVFSKRFAIASALIFISFPTFVNDIMFLNRQEIAFLYVSVILGLVLCGGRNILLRRLLIALMLAGMTVAHYSTSFVFLATMAVAVVGLSASKVVIGLFVPHARRSRARGGRVARLRRSSTFRLNSRTVVFNWVLLLVAGVLVLSWSFVDFQTSPSFSQNLHQVLDALTGKASADAKSQAVNYSVTSSGNNSSAAQQMAAYRVMIEDAIGTHPVKEGYYPRSVVDRYPTPPEPSLRSAPASPVGTDLIKLGVNPYQLNSLLRNLIARLLQVFAVIAVVLVFMGWRRSGRITAEHTYIAVGSIVLLAASVVLPVVSVSYGLLRMFQQSLFVLAPLVIMGALVILRPLGARRAEVLACVLTGVCFISLTGLLPQITGSYSPELNLNNAGEYYENYYTEPQEVLAIRWLDTVAPNDSVVQTNPFAAARFQPYTSIALDPTDFPPAILRDAYVVLGRDTVRDGISTAEPNGELVDYRYPITFLKKYKNLVYSSPDVEIFAPKS